MNILNKSYKRKGVNDSDIFKVQSIDGSFVLFYNGARCKLDTFITDFDEISEISDSSEMLEPTINVETFLNTPIAADALLDQMEAINKNPNLVLTPSPKLNESKSLDDRNERVYNQQSQQNNSLEDRLGDATPKAPQQVRPAYFDVFDNVKLSEEIEIVVPFTIKLPKAEKLDILNDMFNTSYSAYLAKKYINDNIINNSVKLQNLIKEGIENWMTKELSEYKPKKQKKKTSQKHDVTHIQEIAVDVTVSEPENPNMFFAQHKPWDGNIKTLFVINTQEQYDAVKKRFIALKDTNPESPDIDRFEDMLQIYEEQIK